MTLPHHEHSEAAAELDAAVFWYESQEPGIGYTLIDRAESARQDISEWPGAAPVFVTAEDGSVIRGKAIRGYPYRIIYAATKEAILILAYAHERRKPGYWLDRLEH